ncbi:autotransporter domain-containing protein [Phragmitibacter flavus]|uniref:Autotransporter domain-containing protein n=1 Tax=Phragmitibacter flavus TaxID=2576071 RepID=A0A5R8KJJ7_9BACT|nr:autotransporter domain-containing protein [Phragmitibacter flavus]TLD72462.1 autotransporter domain-containing protein [Phragmitibacter flavus]
MKNFLTPFITSSVFRLFRLAGRPLRVLSAIALPGLWLFAPGQISAQTVSITGDVDPSPAVSPIWPVGGPLFIGVNTNGTLQIEAGGAVSNTFGYIGAFSGSTGEVTVTGSGSLWENASTLDVGLDGSGTLNIEAGGKVSNTSGYIGYFSGGTGDVTVTGSGSIWENSDLLAVGRAGTGTLNIEAGGMVSNTLGYIGRNVGSTGEVTVTGSGSLWENSDILVVGSEGSGTLQIEAGGKVSNTFGSIGFLSGSTGEVTVTGIGSLWENSAALAVGENGSGTLNIEAGGMVSNTVGYIGLNSGSGVVTVTGSGSLWENSDLLAVGLFGSGTLNIEAGGKVSNTIGYIGLESGSTGEVTVTGSGSLWENSGILDVGFIGDGTLNIEAGGKVSNTEGYIGFNVGSTGEVTVTGSGSLWENSAALDVGFIGDGTLNIEAGGMVSNTEGYIAHESGSTGEVTVTGIGSLWENSEILFVGNVGSGALNIEAGGMVSNTTSFIGYLSGSTGGVTVTGIGSLWENSSTLYVGTQGSGTLNIEAGGMVTSTDVTLAVIGATSKGTLNLDGSALSRGVLETAYVTEGSGTLGGKINFNGGILRATGDESNFLRNFESGDVEFLIGGAFFDSQQHEIGISTILTGGGGLTKLGTGTLTLTDSNTYSGDTAINGGTLIANNTIGSATGTGAVSVNNGGTLAGDGFITGIVTIQNGGTLAPGLSPGTLSLGELVIEPTAFLSFELGTPNVIGGPTNDLVDVVQDLQSSGSTGDLTLNGGTFDIFSLGGIGTYTLIAWDGTLTQTDTPTIGLWQAGYLFEGGLVVDETLKEVQLTVTTDGLQFWDGSGTSADGILTGGPGTWNLTDTQWTNSDGSAANATWQDGFGAVFSGLSGGTVTLNDNINLGEQGLHFVTDGYTLTGTGTFTIDQPDTLFIINDGLTATINNLITGAGGIEKNGLGEIIFTQNQTYTGDTLIRYGTLSTQSLASSAVSLQGGNFSPGGIGSPTSIQVASLSLDGGSLLFDIGSGGTDHIEVLDGLAQLNAPTLFAFNDTGIESGLYPLISGLDSGWDLSLLSWNGLSIPEGNFLFSDDGTELFFRAYFDEFISGAILQNSLPVATPIDANFQVNGNVRTGTTSENNIVNSLIFAPASNLQVFNNLTITSGNFTTQGGKATIQGGTILVPGDFNKFGPGILDARSNFIVNGNAFIHSGALAVNGTFQTNLLHVLGGGTLMGSGLIIGDVINSGTVAPGNSIGTLSIQGNYTQTRSGNLQIEAASLSNHDLLVVSGLAQLSGTLELQSLGYQPEFGDQIPFLQAGRITGTFDTITMPDPDINRGRFLNLGNTGVLLIAPASYTLVANTPNETQLARALDQWIGIETGDIGQVTLALDLQRADQYSQAFAAISPAYYEGALSTAIELSHNHSQLLHQQLNARRLAYRVSNVPAMPEAPSAKSSKDAKSIAPQVQPDNNDLRWSAWTQGSGLFSKGGLSLTPGEDFESGTILVGADYLLTDNLAIGLFASYQEGWGDYDNGGDIDLDATRFGLYATYDQGGFYANATIGGGQTSFDIQRPIRWAYLDRTATSNPDAYEFFTSLSTGYDLKRGNWTFGPQLSLQYSNLSLDNTTEGGAGALNLRLDDPQMESLRTYLGGRIAYTIQVNDRFAIIPEVRAFWQHEYLDGGSVNATLDSGNGPSFTHTFSNQEKDSFFLGAGLGFQMGTRFYANLYYNLDLSRRDEENHTVSISATIRF